MAKNNLFGSSSNPLLKEGTFKPKYDEAGMIDRYDGDVMTVNGAVNKTILLFSLMMFTTAISFIMPSQFLLYVGAGGVFLSFLAVGFKPQLAPVIAPLYALLEGLFIGSITYMYGAMYDGIVIQAIGLTFGTFATMLFLYKSGIVKVTDKFRAGVSMAVGAVMIFYLISWVAHMFGFDLPLIHDSGPMGIGLVAIILVIASLNLLLDFDNFDRGEKQGAPIYMEWKAAMGLIFTVVWLYVEFLRLLSKLRD